MPIDYLAERPQCVCDTECYPNLWAIGFRSLSTRKVVKIWMCEYEELDRARISTILRNHRFYTFNGINYDLPMIMRAMQGATCEEMKIANDQIIVDGMKYWEFYDAYGIRVPDWIDHVDVMEVAPSAAQRASLKKYAGMMHSKHMQELPYDPSTYLDEDQIAEVLSYLDNDLENTDDLASELQPQVLIRAKISVKIGVDCRSKSDAQVGEAIMRARVEKRMGGKKLYKPDIRVGAFYFEAPAYIKFQTQPMQEMLSRLLRSPFVVKRDGYVQLPEIFGAKKKDEDEDEEHLEGGAEIVLGNNVYKMGIGGLHSQEKSVSFYEDDDYIIVDRDVRGYYPGLIISSGREPDNMRGHFTAEYKKIKEQRDIDKIEGRKDEAESGKIATNGLFGKTGSPYSIVYSPPMLIQTTVSGQVAILMVIEDVVLHGWEVISANTDGFVTRVPRAEYGMFCCVMFDWENETNLITEEVRYRSIHARDVNNYVAFKHDGKGGLEVKRKGVFTPSGRGIPAALGLKKTPNVEICYDAVIAFLKDGTPIESTIRECQDIRKFVNVRKVKGGAMFEGELVAKVVRFYYADDVHGTLTYRETGNKVPRSKGAQPCMRLPDELPRNIDYEWYEREAYAILDDVGLESPDPTLIGRIGMFYGRLEDQKTVHRVDASTGIARCGMKRKQRRDQWVEFMSKPEDQRYCAKCRKDEEL